MKKLVKIKKECKKTTSRKTKQFRANQLFKDKLASIFKESSL